MTDPVSVDQPGYRVAESVRSYFEGIAKGPTYLEEAEFGIRRIIPRLEALPTGARVLEVGSGPCILLAEITERFPQLRVTGIEPMSDGFAFFDSFLTYMRNRSARLDIHLGGYESFPDQGGWDLIFLVNVFEHLPNWRDFLAFVKRALAPDGRCIILCPNYAFPYESHFRLPILFNKAITGTVFRARIEEAERLHDNHGLYKSLNFVKLAQVRRAAAELDLDLECDTRIITDLIDRLDTDPAFRERQKVLALPARALRRSGLLGLLLGSRTVQNRLPYLEMTIRRKS